MKRCYKCKTEKNENEFPKNKNKKDGLDIWCKGCHHDYQMQIKEKRHNEYVENRREIIKEKQEYYQEHKEERIEYGREYCPKYYAKNKHTLKYRYKRYKLWSKNRNLEFDLTLEQFENICDQSCIYCGDDQNLIGIDRIDNNIGYKIENCAPCCQVCNSAKGILTYKEWIDYITQVIKYRLNNSIRIIERDIKRCRTQKTQYSDYKYASKVRDLIFNISLEQFEKFFEKPCHYCGTITKKVIGIDRMDNNIGYEIENCVSCCKSCNFGKRSNSYDAWLAWIDRIVEHNRGLII